MTRAGKQGLLVLFDAYSPFDADQPGKFVKLAVGCRETQLILAHMHGPQFAQLLVGAGSPNAEQFSCDFTADEIAALAHDNAAQLFGLEGAS